MQLCINMQSHEYEEIHECYCTMNKLALIFHHTKINILEQRHIQDYYIYGVYTFIHILEITPCSLHCIHLWVWLRENVTSWRRGMCHVSTG